MEVGGEGDYIYKYISLYTVTTRMTPALRIRWAAIRAILMFH